MDIDIDYTFYELETNTSLSARSSCSRRQGALLKITFDSNVIGYADCHAWPELGDLPIEQQLANLAKGKLTPLTCCALEFAALDAKSRSQSRNTFEQLLIPHSHFLISHLLDWTPEYVQCLIQQGYTHVKLKLGRHLNWEEERLYTLFQEMPLKLRLDFNETLTPHACFDFLQRLENLREKIEFIEDPFPFHVQEWEAIQKEGWMLACDRQAHRACHRPEAAHVLIIKPAVQPWGEWQSWSGQTCIVTSYLGHPLGQIAAAYVASCIDPMSSFVHGLSSHQVYQPTCFSRHLNWISPVFTLPPGTGFGFDEELEQLAWIPLRRKIR